MLRRAFNSWASGWKSGSAAFVLTYRVMETPRSDEEAMALLAGTATPSALSDILRRMDEFAPIPLAYGLAAMRIVRHRASGWGVQADRLGALGFSAGARRAVRPAFAGAIYGPDGNGAVPDDAPPLFAAAAADDPLFDGTVHTHAAWREAGRPVEAHLYGRGGHGFGMRIQGHLVSLSGWAVVGDDGELHSASSTIFGMDGLAGVTRLSQLPDW